MVITHISFPKTDYEKMNASELKIQIKAVLTSIHCFCSPCWKEYMATHLKRYGPHYMICREFNDDNGGEGITGDCEIKCPTCRGTAMMVAYDIGNFNEYLPFQTNLTMEVKSTAALSDNHPARAYLKNLCKAIRDKGVDNPDQVGLCVNAPERPFKEGAHIFSGNELTNEERAKFHKLDHPFVAPVFTTSTSAPVFTTSTASAASTGKRKFVTKVLWQCDDCEHTMSETIKDLTGEKPKYISYDDVMWELVCDDCRKFNYIEESVAKEVKVEAVARPKELEDAERTKWELELLIKKTEIDVLNAKLLEVQAALKNVNAPIPPPIAAPIPAPIAAPAPIAPIPVKVAAPAVVPLQGNRVRFSLPKREERLTYIPPDGAPMKARRNRTSVCPLNAQCTPCKKYLNAALVWQINGYSAEYAIISNRYKPCNWKVPTKRIKPVVIEEQRDNDQVEQPDSDDEFGML